MNEDKIKKILIELYSNYSIIEIKNNCKLLLDAFNIKNSFENNIELIPDIFNKKEYQKYHKIVTEIKNELEIIMENYSNNKDQIYCCLDYIMQTTYEFNYDKSAILHTLIRKLFQNKWSNIEMEMYVNISYILINWKDYFISYTNRNAYEVNNIYKNIIAEILSDYDYNKNIIAKIIVKYLSMNNVIVFYDENNLYYGENVKELIEQNCEKAFCFIQIVEPISFKIIDNDDKNWCHIEYCNYKKSKNSITVTKNYYFILLDELSNIEPAKLPKQYTEWFNEIKDSKFIVLDTNNTLKIRKEMRSLAKTIADSCKHIKTEIIDSVINDKNGVNKNV